MGNDMIEAAAVILAKKGADYLAKRLGSDVIERWSRHRANGFVEALYSAISEGKPDWEIAPLLDVVLQDEKNSEVLFEAYRSVSLSRSKEVGPRAIGLLTAKIVTEKRTASPEEETWQQAFEGLSDTELFLAHDFLKKAFDKANGRGTGLIEKCKIDFGQIVVEWSSELGDFKASADRSPLDLHEYMGSWAAKLSNWGILQTRITEKVWDYPEDSERHVDEPGTARRITHEILFDLCDEEFATLIGRAYRMVPIKGKE